LLIWKEPARVTRESADFAAADGPRGYSGLEGIDAYGSKPMCRYRWAEEAADLEGDGVSDTRIGG